MNQKALKQKQDGVAELANGLTSAKSFALFEYQGLKAREMQVLRRDMLKSGAGILVFKNTLLARALKQAKVEGVDPQLLNGPNAIAFGSETDEIAPFRLVANVAKDRKFVKVKLGRLDGKLYDGKGVLEIAALPGRHDLYAMLANVLNQPVAAFARAIKAVADQKEAPPAPPAPEAAPPAAAA